LGESDINLKKMRKARALLQSKTKMAAGTAFRFIKHTVEDSPQMLWRIATFNSSAEDIRNGIVLPLAEILTNIKNENLNRADKEENKFKLVLFLPELILKLQGFLRKAAVVIGQTAVSQGPKLYRKNKSGELNKVKDEIKNLILIRFWATFRKEPLKKENQEFIKRLRAALDASMDFSHQPELKTLAQTVQVELGFDKLQAAVALYRRTPNAKKPRKKRSKRKEG
jgi:hypothetical protein